MMLRVFTCVRRISVLSFLLAFSPVCGLQAGLIVTALKGVPVGNIEAKQTVQATGCSSLRYTTNKAMITSTRTGDSIPAPFRAPDRDLGQTFKAPRDMKLDAVVIRVNGSGGSAGSAGLRLAIQIFKVTGTPVLHDNGTSTKLDDWITGEVYTQITVAKDGVAPKEADVAGTYIKFDLTGTDEVSLTKGQQYAFMLMLQDRNTTGAKLCLANAGNNGNYPDGHKFRREGGCGDPNPPEYSPDFCEWEKRLRKAPGTWGHPDVCTYSDLVFYVLSVPGPATHTAHRRFVGGSSPRESQRFFDIRGRRVRVGTAPSFPWAHRVLITESTRSAAAVMNSTADMR